MHIECSCMMKVSSGSLVRVVFDVIKRRVEWETGTGKEGKIGIYGKVCRSAFK